MRKWLYAAAGLGLLGMIPFGLQFGFRKVELGSVAVIEIPRRARLGKPGAPSEHGDWVGYRLDRFHNWAVGSGTPYRASLFVNVHAIGSPPSGYDNALKANERQLNGGATDWKQLSRDDRWDIGQGRYTINMLDEPTWRITFRDPARRVSLLWQVFQKDWRQLDDAKAALQTMSSSTSLISRRLATGRARRQPRMSARRMRPSSGSRRRGSAHSSRGCRSPGTASPWSSTTIRSDA
jgi:hypothetical protein